MGKMEINGLSPKEKIRFKEFENLWKKGTDFYWKIAILLFFFWQLIDIILTITFSSFGWCGFGYLLNIPFYMNNIAQLWYQFSVFFMMVGFTVSWMFVKQSKKEKLAAAVVIIIWGIFFAFMMSMEPWIKDDLVRQFIAIAEFLVFLGITVFLAIKVKWSKFIWVMVGYLSVLLILYYGFYSPLFSIIGSWPSPPSFSNPPFHGIIGHIPPILGIISAIFMAWASSEKGRRWAAFSHILEERKKKRK